MQIIIHQQMNIIPAIIQLLFLMYASNVLDKKSIINKIYLVSVSLNLLLIVLDLVFNFILSIEGVLVFLPRILLGLVFTLAPLLSYLYLKFVCCYFSTPYKINSQMKITFNALIIINMGVAIFTCRFKTFSEGVMITEYIIPFIISVIFLMYSIFVIISNKKMLIKFEYIYISTISLITSAFVLIQLFTNEARFIWFGSTFTLILMFIVIQQRELYRDVLTGVRNRLVLKKCLDEHSKKPFSNLSVVMIDLDYFKNINDSYGHSEGDYALKTFARLLQKVYSDNGIVIRMGGDEFLVLICGISTIDVNELIKKMSKLVDRYNNKGIKPYRIKYSCAYGTYDSSSDGSIDQFIHEIDLKMYQNKNGRRSKGKILSAENI